MRVLLATDGSKDAKTALRTASRLVRKEGNQFHVLCVAPEIIVPRPGGRQKSRMTNQIRERYRQRIQQDTKEILEEAREIMRAEGVAAETLAEIGSPSEVIVRMADDYDLTVVGAHGRYERTQPGIGPVASQVVEHASGAVLVARDLVAESSFRILVGVDGSLASEAALDMLSSNYNVITSEITLMHVIEMPWLRLGLQQQWIDYAAEDVDRSEYQIGLEGELRLEAEEVLERARLRLEEYGLSAETMVGEGNPGQELLSEAIRGEYDLVVLGATGLADIKRAMLGSVSVKVAHNAPCSVLVVKNRL
ncbi:MAG TPA: universal stress protein [Blastocatellia bacterium]|nr:universal stress protein [Blastocatellia bacterium]